jgi:hypothetical protein
MSLKFYQDTIVFYFLLLLSAGILFHQILSHKERQEPKISEISFQYTEGRTQ